MFLDSLLLEIRLFYIIVTIISNRDKKKILTFERLEETFLIDE